MMKRPRSFISTLVVILAFALTAGIGISARIPQADAGGLPRVMDPRAGDPTQPDDSPLPGDSRSEMPEPDALRLQRPTYQLQGTTTPPQRQDHALTIWRLMSFIYRWR